MKIWFLLLLLLIFCGSFQPARAAFAVKTDSSRITHSDSSTARHLTMGQRLFGRDVTNNHRGVWALALLCTLVSLAAIIGFFVTLPVSLPTAMLLGIGSQLFGALAIFCALTDSVSNHSKSGLDMVLIILSELIILPIIIPATIIVMIYDLLRTRRHKKKTNSHT